MVTLTGKIADVTGRAPDSISSITVKAPSARIGGGSDIIVTSNAQVEFNKGTGNLTLSGLHVGLSWLYIEGDGWSDSIPLAVAEGFQLILEAVANASGIPGIADYVSMLRNSEDHARLLALAALDGEFGTLVRAAQNAAETAEQAATSAENTVDSYTPRVDALEAMGGLSPESPADGQTANLIAQPGTLTSAAVIGKIESHVPADVVTSPYGVRILVSDDPDTPLEEGDLLLVFAPPPTEFFTDFSEYPLDQFPADWTQRWKTGDWCKVVADPSATGGVVLREEDVPTAGANRALSWDRVGAHTDVEIVMKWQTSNAGAPTRPIVRGAGNTIPTGYHGGSQNGSTSSLQAAVNSLTNVTLQEATRSFDGDVWYITRLRAVGSTIAVKTWVADEPEPTAWEFEVEDTSIPEPGWVGIRTFSYAGTRLFDWVGVAVGGRTAPMEPIS